MKKIKLIYALFLCFLVGILTGCTSNHITVKEKIDEINYVTVNVQPSGVKYYVDLSAKKLYGYKYATHNNTIYDYDETYQSRLFAFDHFKKVNLLYPIIADQTSVGEVKKSDYVIVKNVKNHSNQRKVIEFLHDYGFKGYKVKIFYNHDCLPIKVQLIDRETKKWKTIAKYSYLHITAKEYEKNWKEYVKEIKAGDFLDE